MNIDKLYKKSDILNILENSFVDELKKIKSYEVELNSKNLDLISLEYYNDASLWWIIALYNDIVDPFNVTNKEIKVPNFFEVNSLYSDYIINESEK